MGAGVGTGAHSLTNWGFDSAGDGWIYDFVPAKTGQLVKTDVRTSGTVSTVTRLTTPMKAA